MSENLNWIDQIKKSFQSFEPEVTGDWKRMEQNLDALNTGATNEMARRMRNAQRVAFGATAIAAGMALWVLAPSILSVESAEGSVLAKTTQAGSPEDANVQYGAVQSHSLFSPSGNALDGYPSEGARTSSTFVIDLPSLTVKASASSEAASTEPTASSAIAESASAEHSIQPEPTGSSAEVVGEGAADKSAEPSLSPEAKLDAALEAMTASVQEACAGTEVTFALNGLDQEGSVLWNFGDGGFSQDVAPTHVFNNAGSYDITVSVRAPGDGIIRTRTVENMIVVRPKPDAAMNWEFYDATSNQARVHFINETEDASSSTWLLEQEGLSEAEAMLEIPGDYHVNLVASNKFGCQDIAVQDIHLGSRKEAIAPALFSPDGDGRYDTFMPLMLMDFEGKWELTVWDGGDQVFESSRTRRPWRGELANGGTAEVGKKYTWKLVTETPTGEKHLFVDEVLIDGE